MSRRSRERHRLEEQFDFVLVDDRLLKRASKDRWKLKEARRERNSNNYRKRRSGYYTKKGT